MLFVLQCFVLVRRRFGRLAYDVHAFFQFCMGELPLDLRILARDINSAFHLLNGKAPL